MAKKGVLLTDKDENFLYPQTILEMVTNKEQTVTLDVLLRVLRENLESDIEDTNTDVSILRDELNALLSDETLSGEVRDAILEINSLLNSGSSDITSEVITTIRQLKENAVLHSQQSLTSSQKQQARQNIDAAGVSATYGNGLATISYNGNAIFPETKGQQVKLSIGGNAEDAIKQNGSNIVKEKERAQQVEMYLESQKANKYGYYEGLSVGVSDNLSGRGEATESEFSFRPSGGENKSIEDGTARINSIKGNSVVYNQLSVISSKKFTIKNDTDNEIGSWLRGLPALNGREGHKLYIVATNDSDADCYINLLQTYDINTGAICEYNNTIGATPALYCRVPPNTNKEITVTLKITDLTQMFNGVNEPTTVEEFEALYGNMPSEYSAGTIIDNHTSAIKSIGVNAWDEEWIEGYVNSDGNFSNGGGVSIMSKGYIKVCPDKDYYCKSPHMTSIRAYDDEYNYLTTVYNVNNSTFHTPTNCRYILFSVGSFANPYTPAVYNHDICIHLVHTGYLNGKYFPYESQTRELPTVEGGLKSTRYKCDEIRYNKGKDKWEHVKRIGQVDLGTLDWGLYNEERKVYAVGLKGELATKPVGDAICSNIYKYDYGSYANMADKSISLHPSMLNGNILLRNTDISSVSELKLSLQGVILNYELAEPVVTELDVDISPDYKVWDYGTEEAISEVLSTPVRINANYGFNAVGQITDNTELIKELLARVDALESQIAQQTNAAALVQVVDE